MRLGEVMKDILNYIQEKNAIFEKAPLMVYLNEKSISPLQRLSFAPCMAFFTMSFKDINENILREEPTEDKYQQMINRHTYEDAVHWDWYFEDLEALSLNKELKFSEAAKFLWSDYMKESRFLVHEFYKYCYKVKSIYKMVAIEAMEMTGNVVLNATARVVNELLAMGEKKTVPLKYYGQYHVARETGHHMNTDDIGCVLEGIVVAPEDKKQCFKIVDMVYSTCTKVTTEMKTFCEKNNYSSLARSKSYI